MALVESEAILEVDYDSASARLYVRFADGQWYSYFGVPASIHRDFLRADSHGRFFHERIRDRYPYRRGR